MQDMVKCVYLFSLGKCGEMWTVSKRGPRWQPLFQDWHSLYQLRITGGTRQLSSQSKYIHPKYSISNIIFSFFKLCAIWFTKLSEGCFRVCTVLIDNMQHSYTTIYIHWFLLLCFIVVIFYLLVDLRGVIYFPLFRVAYWYNGNRIIVQIIPNK